MLGSSSNFFHKPIEEIRCLRDKVSDLLFIKGYNIEQVKYYLKSYDYFTVNPKDFDGSTLTKDLCDIRDLDIDAMSHDWLYIVCNAGCSIKYKWMADMIFAKGIEQKGKSLYAAYSRFAGLTLSGIGFIPFARIKRGKINDSQKREVKLAYELIVKQGII